MRIFSGLSPLYRCNAFLLCVCVGLCERKAYQLAQLVACLGIRASYGANLIQKVNIQRTARTHVYVYISVGDVPKLCTAKHQHVLLYNLTRSSEAISESELTYVQRGHRGNGLGGCRQMELQEYDSACAKDLAWDGGAELHGGA